MGTLPYAVVFWVGLHVVVAGSGLRFRLIDVVGENLYRGIFSLLSFLGIYWLCAAYGRAELVPLWNSPAGLRWVAIGLMAIAALLVIVGLTTPNPTSVGGEYRLKAKIPAVGILRITRHPFLAGVAIWGSTHFVLNGDLASMLFFGALTTVAVAGTASIDRKRRVQYGESYAGFAAATSVVPFLAIAQGRNELRLAELGLARIGLALVTFVAALAAHRHLFGDSPFPL